MVAEPTALPVTRPLNGSIEAIPGEELPHEPGVVASVSKVVLLRHTLVVPPMAAGNGLTVNTAVVKQVVLAVYVKVTVPAFTPVTVPDDEPTVAVSWLALLHVPPPVRSPRVVDRPGHTGTLPYMPDGCAFTVTVVVVLHPLIPV